MRAIVASGFGEPASVLSMAEGVKRPALIPGQKQLLLRVLTVGLSPGDWRMLGWVLCLPHSLKLSITWRWGVSLPYTRSLSLFVSAIRLMLRLMRAVVVQRYEPYISTHAHKHVSSMQWRSFVYPHTARMAVHPRARPLRGGCWCRSGLGESHVPRWRRRGGHVGRNDGHGWTGRVLPR